MSGMAAILGAMTDKINPREFQRTDGLADWRVMGDGASCFFRTGSYAEAAQLAGAIAALDGVEANPPHLDVRPDGVTVRLITVVDGYYGMTLADADLAQRIAKTADSLGLAADPSVLQNVQISIDALVIAEVLPFWRAVLGYTDRGDNAEDLIDPGRRGPLTYFQQMDAPRPQRNRIHLDIWVPHDLAQARVAAALAAGGRLVTDEFAPSWWVLADAEGNEACVCSSADRGE
jgi:4a-hydroxytetrahydrobiopterin dehydratase